MYFTKEDYNKIVSLPWNIKVQKTIASIINFKNQSDCYVSLSGGKGSTVLADIVKRFDLDIPCVCVPSCEEKENIQITLNYDTTYVNGKYTMREIITNYGYPMINKQVAMAVSRHHRTKLESQKHFRLYGKIKDGKHLKVGTIPKKYHFMIYAPFEISEQCCDFRKKKPLKKYAKENNRLPITGEMATESQKRGQLYRKHGCIQEGKKCTPMGSWNDSDLDAYIKKYNVQISELYVNNESQRTGCPECGFGILEQQEKYNKIKNTRKREQILNGGQWTRKDIYRWVRFRHGSILIWSNLYWTPSDEGLGTNFVLKYIIEGVSR